MVDTIVKITTWTPDHTNLSITVTAEETAVSTVKVTLEVDADTVGVVTIDPSDSSLEVTGLRLSGGAYVGCLAACGLGHIVSDIIECRRQGNTTVKKLVACLKAKGQKLSLDLINCAVSCIPAALTP